MTDPAIAGPSPSTGSLDRPLGRPTIAPPRAELRPWEATQGTPELPSQADLAAGKLDPGQIARLIDANPDRLSDPNLTPGLMHTLARVLLTQGRVFQAEGLLARAWAAQPENPELGRAWGRVLVYLGRVERALPVLEAAVAKAPGDAALRFVLGGALLSRSPRATADVRRAIAAWEKALALQPSFRSLDGTTGAQLQAAINQMKMDLARGRAASPAGRRPLPPAIRPVAAP